MGLLQMALTVYGVAITFAVSGLCVATSRLVAEGTARGDPGAAKRVAGVAGVLALGSGAALWLVLSALAAPLASGLLGEARAALALKAIAPAILPISLTATLKGYFQGLQDMAPTSKAQIVEQVVRVGAMLVFVYALRGAGPERAVGGAAAGNVAGALAALVFLMALLGRRSLGRKGAGARKPRPERSGGGRSGPARSGEAGVTGLGAGEPWSRTASRVLEVAIPVSLSAAILPVMDIVLTFLTPGRLAAAGVSSAEVTYLYGQLLGLAYPLAGLPAIVASALAAALIPAILRVG
jgi:O-antigen/teichoic acid export membrane protein